MSLQKGARRHASNAAKTLVRASRPARDAAAVGAQTVRYQLGRAEGVSRTLAAAAGRRARRAPLRTALIAAGVGLGLALLLRGRSRRKI